MDEPLQARRFGLAERCGGAAGARAKREAFDVTDLLRDGTLYAPSPSRDFDAGRSPAPQEIAYRLFSQLVEFVACELVCEAFSSLRAAGRFNYSPLDEARTVQAILKEYPQVCLKGREPCESLDELALLFRALHQKMNVLVTRGDLESVTDLTLGPQPGVFINDVTRRVRELACAEEGLCSQDFHVKVCVDDCETLHPDQQRFLNSLVRTSKHPLFWIVSFVSADYDSSSTVIHNQRLTDADRTQLLLPATQATPCALCSVLLVF
jgi:hypothetical protein